MTQGHEGDHRSSASSPRRPLVALASSPSGDGTKPGLHRTAPPAASGQAPHTGLKPADPRELGAYVNNYAVTLAARVRDKAGVELDHGRAVRELAEKTMEVFFRKRGIGGYLVKHHYPLRKLAEELGPRSDEAFDELVTSYRRAANPEQAPDIRTHSARYIGALDKR